MATTGQTIRGFKPNVMAVTRARRRFYGGGGGMGVCGSREGRLGHIRLTCYFNCSDLPVGLLKRRPLIGEIEGMALGPPMC